MNGTSEEDYIDQLTGILPWHPTFTPLERTLIVVIVSMFVSMVGCFLLCLMCSRSPLRRRYDARRRINKEQPHFIGTVSRKSVVVYPAPPSYESTVKVDNVADLRKLSQSRYLNLARKLSNGTVSDSDGPHLNPKTGHGLLLQENRLRSQSARSSLSHVSMLSTISNTYPLAPYAQISVELDVDTTNQLVNLHLTNAEHFSVHPAFDEQAVYLVRVQLLNNKLLKKYQDAWKKRRSSLSFENWKKQDEKTTKGLIRQAASDTLTCDEHMQFQFNKSDLTAISFRFLLTCVDRTSLQDIMFEALIPMQLSMIPHHQQIVEFTDLPQITFAEVFLGLSYLPTSERLTISINKLRYCCKIDKEKKIDARLITTFMHNGRRFFQKKTPFTLDGSTSGDYDLNDTITQNVPQHDIQSVHVHFELNSDDDTLVPSTSILLGKQTHHQSDWQRMLEYPRQTHLGWYPFLG